MAIGAVPCRNTMSPPQLARDAPVMDVLHPLQVDGPVVVRRNADVAFGDGARRRLGKAHAAVRRLLVNRNEPLLGKPRLNNSFAAVALADGVGMVLGPRQQAALLQVLQNSLSRIVAVETFVGSAVFIDARLLVHHRDLWQIVTLANLKVIGIVRRRDFHRAAAELMIGISRSIRGSITFFPISLV